MKTMEKKEKLIRLCPLYVKYFSLKIYNQSVFLPKRSMFYDFFLKIIFLVYIILSVFMMSWSGLGQKIMDVSRNTLLTGAAVGLGGYSGTFINSRLYSSNTNREHIFGTVYIDTENYNPYTLKVLRKLGEAYDKQDVDRIYKFWALIIRNPGGNLSKNYGKLNNTINLITNQYNQTETPEMDEKLITERGFIEYYNLPVDEQSYSKVSKDQYNNLVETITIEILNRKNPMIQYKRNHFNDLEISNLGLQSNNDCIFTLRYNLKEGKIELGYVDCKKTDDFSFRLKLEEIQNEGYFLQKIPEGKAIFGCNLYLIASDKKDIVLNQMEKNVILKFVKIMATENPQFFRDYKSSPEFMEFETTGKFNVLASSIHPFPKGITNVDCRKFLKNVDHNKDYNQLLKELDQETSDRSSNIIINQITNDDS